MPSRTPTMCLTPIALALAAVVSMGCYSSGLSTRETGFQTQGAFVAALAEDATTDLVPAPFVAPANIAVAQIGEIAPPHELIEGLRKETSLFSRVQPIAATDPSIGVSHAYQRNDAPTDRQAASRGVENLRRLARVAGADYLLMAGGTADISTRGTPLSAANLTIIGMFLVPSHKATAVVKANAAIVDVKTGRIVAMSSVDREDWSLATFAARDGQRDDLLNNMRSRIAKDLAKQVIEDVKRAPTTSAKPGAPAIDATARS